MSHPLRIVVVTLGLVGGGMVCGAVAGAGTVFALLLFSGELTADQWMAIDLVIAAILGAALGAITAPVLSWLLLRRVPLGRMFIVCTAGTILGALAGVM